MPAPSETPPPSRELFVNLPVTDLPGSMRFFAALGFTFDPRFTNEQAACMIVSDKAWVMLLQRPFFETFTDNQLCDTASHTEALIAFSCQSAEEVDRMVALALEHGGRSARPRQDLGFMVSWSFYDLDGHHWEPLFMDMSKVPWLQEGGSGSPG